MNKELEFLLYNTPDEDININVIIKDENLWLTQKTMSELFDCTSDNISLHLKNIFFEGELDKNAVTEKFSVTASEGSISRTAAEQKAHREYDKFNKTQKIISDFDKQIQKLKARKDV